MSRNFLPTKCAACHGAGRVKLHSTHNQAEEDDLYDYDDEGDYDDDE
jgi:hypothetical protein